MSDTTLTKEKFHEGIRPDGSIEGQMFETYYQPLESLTLADGYLRVISDAPGMFTETRIPFSALEKMGFTRTDIPRG